MDKNICVCTVQYKSIYILITLHNQWGLESVAAFWEVNFRVKVNNVLEIQYLLWKWQYDSDDQTLIWLIKADKR